MERKFKAIAGVLTVSLIIACIFLFSSIAKLGYAKNEMEETAALLQKAMDENEIDETTDTLRYDVFKVAENDAIHHLKDGEQLVHVNVGFGSLDRGLKYVNDNYGHLNGRPTIINFSNLLKDVFKEEDGWVLCHRGGSGFLAFKVGNFTEEDMLGYYEELKARWHDTPYKIPMDESKSIDGMALLFLCVIGPECGNDFRSLRDCLVYKKLSLRDITNCGYVIQTAPDKYISNVEINEEAYMEDN